MVRRILTQSDNGFSQISDPYGRAVAQENHVGQEGTMMALAPVMPTGTLYPIVGDIVGQLSVVGLVLAIVAVVAQRFLRARRERQPMTAEAA